MNNETKGYLLGFIGVVIFGLTLPATRIAVMEFPPVFVGLGRALVAAVIAGGLLAVTRAPRPKRRDLGKLAIAAAGIIFGFPLLSAIAMQTAPASHGGVVLGILPLATAIAAVIFARERPSIGFWLCGAFGAAAVVTFALLDGGVALYAADTLLALSVAAAAVGYAISGDLARRLGGWQVISWALVISIPVLLVPVIRVLPEINWQASAAAWMAFFYVAVFSQFLGFFFWNQGLALGGVAKVGQVQLLQVFVTLVGSFILLSEPIKPVTLFFALIVIAAVALARQMRVKQR